MALLGEHMLEGVYVKCLNDRNLLHRRSLYLAALKCSFHTCVILEDESQPRSA